MEVSAAQKKLRLQSSATQKIMAFGGLIALVVVFSLASPNFLQFGNVVSIVLATCVTGVLALGITFVIVTGGIDLSVGTVMTFSAVMSAVFVTYWGLPVPLGVCAGIAAGATCGFVSGGVISKLGIPPFIATLGVMMVTRGLSLVISGTKPIYLNDSPAYAQIAMGSVISKIIPGFEIPNAVLIFLAAAVCASLILSKTVLGRYTYALGSNEEAARLSGIKVDVWKIRIYMLCGAFCGLAGVLMASRLSSAQPGLGSGYEFEAITAAVIGGTSLNGGEGSILGTVIGAFIMSVLTNGLRILSVPQEWQLVVTGLILVLAVYTDNMRRKK